MGIHRVRALAAVGFVFLFSLPLKAATVTVGAGGNLQAAIDNAAPGDTILLEAGATFTGNFVVRSTASGLTIRSSAPDSSLPAAGQRTGPAYAAFLPKLRSPNSVSALAIQPGASYITIVNVEFLPSSVGTYSVIELGYADSRQTTTGQAPHHLVLDRILMNIPEGVPQKRGIALNSGATTIKDSYLYGLKYDGEDAQAICGWNGPGPYLIENNRLTASGENVLFGGGDPRIVNLVPSNIQVLRNHMDKPLSWKGSVWDVKNIFELKNAQDVLIEGNVFEYNWLAAQSGFAILFTPRNQDGTAPWSVVQRVVFRNNIVRHVSSAFNLMGRDNLQPSALTNDIEISNNLFEDVNWTAYGGSGRVFQLNGGDNIRIRNNTSNSNPGQFLYVYSNPVLGFVFENNLMNYGSYGIHGDSTSPGNATITKWLPGSVILGNVIVKNPSPWSYPTGNYYPADWATVQMGSDYRLLPGSPYLAAGTDGKPAGANIDDIDAARASGALPQIPSCTLTVSPASHNSPAGGDAVSVSVGATDSSCAWSVSSDQSWATASQASGTGSGAVTVTVAPNGTSSQRTANLVVAGNAVTIIQPAVAVPPGCTFTLTPGSVTVSGAATTLAATLTASDASCAWSAGSAVNWISVGPTSGTGSATLSVVVAAARSNGTRNGTVSAAGRTLTVQQFGRKKK